MNGDPLRQAADTVDAVAIGEDKAALIVLWARSAERMVLGTLCEDECAAIMRLMVPGRGIEPRSQPSKGRVLPLDEPGSLG